MRELGVEPDGIVGHSTGELGCAYGDGCLSEEETLRAAHARGKASLAVDLVRGMMASIGKSSLGLRYSPCSSYRALELPSIGLSIIAKKRGNQRRLGWR